MTPPLQVGDAVADARFSSFGVVLAVLPEDELFSERGIVFLQNGKYGTVGTPVLRAMRDALEASQVAQ